MTPPRLLVGVVLVALPLTFGGQASAHVGETDAQGGHTCLENCAAYGLQPGQYHFHDGRPDPYAPAPKAPEFEGEASLPASGAPVVFYALAGLILLGAGLLLWRP